MEPPRVRAVRLLLFLVVFTAGAPAGASGQLMVIANADTQIEDVRLAELRDLFLGRPTSISALPVVIFENRDLRERFYRSAFSMGVREVKHRWIQVVLTGGRTHPPIEVDADEVLSLVAQTSGAVSFVESPPATNLVRVIRIDGRLPSEPGYPLR